MFAPDYRKYCFHVMPFGSTNISPFYTAMMKCFKEEWDRSFNIRVLGLKTFKGLPATMKSADVIMIGTQTLVAGSKTIIDNILLLCDDKGLI